MQSTSKVAVVIVFYVIVFGSVAVGQTGRIETIRSLSQKIDEQIAQSEQEPDASTTFLTELAVNKNDSPYPAVGIYRTVIKSYYTFGDREKNPYPYRLLKIIVSADRSNRKEYSELVFNEAGQVIFFFEKKDDVERRLYFTSERPIRFQQGEALLDLRGRSQVEFVAAVLLEKAKLVRMFRRSLEF